MKAPLRYAVVFAVSLAILAVGVSTPPMMFDEGAYVGAARNFITDTPTSNPEHPPLAKYFIALSIKVFGDTPFGWRFPSAIAGALLAMSLFGLTFRLSKNWHTARIAWLLTVANVFWFVMSRIAILPIFEVAFSVAAVWAFIIATQEKNLYWFAWSGAFFGFSACCRWVGAFGLVVCVAYALAYYRPFLKSMAVMTASANAAYTAGWIPLLLREHRSISYLLSASAFILQFQRHAKGDPRIGQAWSSWIIRFQPQASLSYVVANPIIAILGLVAMAVLLWRKQLLLPALYIANILPWVIAIRPVTYYYYYFEPFTWLTVALALAMQGVKFGRVRLDVVVTACTAAVFVHWYLAHVLPC
jgi:dolichyl-phosphate-mannose--protein O-mannosyl transferase